MPTSSTTSPSSIVLTPCQVIENNITKITNQVNIMQGRLDTLLNDVNSDLSDVQTARSELANLNKDLLKQKDEQRKQGCPSGAAILNSLDNQTVISTGSVRRKDSKALDIIPMPAASLKTTTGSTFTP